MELKAAGAGDVTRAVLHLAPANGGGVDRFIRDLCVLRPQDRIVHVAARQWVLEAPAAATFEVLTPARAVAALAAHAAPDTAWIVHAHGTVPAVRAAARALERALAAPRVVSLHDVQFAAPDAGEAERGERLRFAAEAALRHAPSAFIAARAQQASQGAWGCEVIALGDDGRGWRRHAAGTGEGWSTAAADARAAGPFPIAVIGALGDHKGLAALEALAARLPADARMVVLGYTGNRLQQGWADATQRLWVHGAFVPAQLPGLVERYGARVAFFPPGVPESWCYALGDAWACGLAVLAPDHGALAERIGAPHAASACAADGAEREPGAQGTRGVRGVRGVRPGAALYPPASDTAALIEHLLALLRATTADAAGPATSGGIGAAAQALAALYARLPARDAAMIDATMHDAFDLECRRHLDGEFFRLELINLQSNVQALEAERAALQQALEAERHHTAEARGAVEQAAHAAAAERNAWAAERAALEAAHAQALANVHGQANAHARAAAAEQRPGAWARVWRWFGGAGHR